LHFTFIIVGSSLFQCVGNKFSGVVGKHLLFSVRNQFIELNFKDYLCVIFLLWERIKKRKWMLH